MVRMRTIREAFNEIISDDPNTALTPFALRTLVKKGTIPSVKIGVRYLLAMEALYEFLGKR